MAAAELFERYLERLTGLARARLSHRLASRIDPEDVVQSAWRSFFVGARQDQFTLERSGDLWRLLVSIMMHKLYRQVRRHVAEVRSVRREDPLHTADRDESFLTSQEPTVEEAVALSEIVESCLAELEPFDRRLFELRLPGEQLETIAIELGCSERTIRRKLQGIREALARRLELDSDGRRL